jgi:hypothetical protein
MGHGGAGRGWGKRTLKGIKFTLGEMAKAVYRYFMKSLAIALALLAMLLTQAAVASCREKASGMGIGQESCAQFGKDYQESPEHWETLYFYWAQGYMSALNTALIIRYGIEHDTSTDLGKWSAGTQEEFVRSYCDQHPLTEYRDAVDALFSEMRKDQKLGDWVRKLLP